MSEIPYVIFTVFSQMAVGALIALLIADFLAKGQEDAKFFETGAWVSVPVAVVALIGILSHEARPIQAMMTMTKNSFIFGGTSWLSNEVLALTVFVILAVIYTILWVLHPDYGSLKWFPILPAIVGKFSILRKPVGLLAAVVGLGFLWVSATSYLMYTLPAWNQPSTFLFFLVTALLAGVAATAAVLSVKYLRKKGAVQPFSTFLWAVAVIAVLMAATAGFAVYSQITNLGLPAATEGAQLAQEASLEELVHGESATFLWLRVVIGIGLVLVCVIGLAVALMKKSPALASIFAIALFVFAFVGEILGRFLFFETVVHINEFIPYVLPHLF